MDKWLKILIGILILSGAICLWALNIGGFGESALTLLKGGLIWMFIFVGLILTIIGVSELKD